LVETRGASRRITGSFHPLARIHYLGEIIFCLPDQKLTIRHDAGSSAQPYVDGALLAIRNVNTIICLRRELDQILDLT
jgi:4-hydroxy-tetrahydrodipicolinate reductase